MCGQKVLDLSRGLNNIAYDDLYVRQIVDGGLAIFSLRYSADSLWFSIENRGRLSASDLHFINDCYKNDTRFVETYGKSRESAIVHQLWTS